MRTVVAIPTTTHGRVLVRTAGEATAVVIGFHGYFESAEIQMERLEAMPGSDGWTLISVQGLHRFYRGRSEDVVASWMTRQDRELMIADNVAYADRVVGQLVPPDVMPVMAGFSQGAAMAFRAAVRGRRRASGVIAVGGDVPPELLSDESATFPATLLVRGARDDWHTAGKLESDVRALAARGAPVESHTVEGGHDWNDAIGALAAAFITRMQPR